MIFALIAFSLGAFTPPQSEGSENVAQLFSSADYPKKAMKLGMEGRVVARLLVSRHGRVKSCEILETSGHEILDKATCKLLRKRARFSPARNQAGKPIEDMFTTPPIVWLLDERNP